MSTTTAPNQLPLPADAIAADDWDGDYRFFFGTERVVETEQGRIVIDLEGEQLADGSVRRRYIYVSPFPNGIEGPAEGPMSIEDARKFGAALIAAADEQAELARLEAQSD